MSGKNDKMVKNDKPEKKDEIVQPSPTPANGSSRFYFLGTEQKFTKNMGNYESFSCGFFLTMPEPSFEGDSIDNEKTRERLTKQYEKMTNFLSDILGKVREQANP